jgi:hypothetical protein
MATGYPAKLAIKRRESPSTSSPRAEVLAPAKPAMPSTPWVEADEERGSLNGSIRSTVPTRSSVW